MLMFNSQRSTKVEILPAKQISGAQRRGIYSLEPFAPSPQYKYHTRACSSFQVSRISPSPTDFGCKACTMAFIDLPVTEPMLFITPPLFFFLAGGSLPLGDGLISSPRWLECAPRAACRSPRRRHCPPPAPPRPLSYALPSFACTSSSSSTSQTSSNSSLSSPQSSSSSSSYSSSSSSLSSSWSLSSSIHVSYFCHFRVG